MGHLHGNPGPRGIQTNEELQQMMFTVVFHNCDQAELNWKMFFFYFYMHC